MGRLVLLQIGFFSALLLVGTFPGYAGSVSQYPSVAIDVGHTKGHPGAMSARGTSEFVFNQAFAQQLRDAFGARGQRVRMINEHGGLKNLRERSQYADGAAFLISVHHDSVQPHYLEKWTYNGSERRFSDRYSGFSLFVSRLNPHVAASRRCASAIGQSLQARGFSFTKHHAEPIAGEGREWADAENGVYYYDELIVLKTAAQPALLFEAGIIVNRVEELELLDADRRRKMADAIADAMRVCMQNGK